MMKTPWSIAPLQVITATSFLINALLNKTSANVIFFIVFWIFLYRDNETLKLAYSFKGWTIYWRYGFSCGDYAE
tara:strand:- start:151 stop:372 length:222 start_codon:yes stop_codon:yes gene_type:complete